MFERLYLEALAALMKEQAAGGDYNTAIACTQRYLATDDLA